MEKITSRRKQGLAAAVFFSLNSVPGLTFLLVTILLFILLVVLYLYLKTKEARRLANPKKKQFDPYRLEEYLSSLDDKKLDNLLDARHLATPSAVTGIEADPSSAPPSSMAVSSSSASSSVNLPLLGWLILLPAILLAEPALAKDPGSGSHSTSLFTQPGIIILFILIMIPILLTALLVSITVTRIVQKYRRQRQASEQQQFNDYLDTLSGREAEAALLQRRRALDYRPPSNQLSGNAPAEDARGLLHNIDSEDVLPFVPAKKRATHRPPVDPDLARLVSAYIVCAAGWLLIGTSVGEYVGIKFVAPDVDHLSWLSFGRLRPVHTNAVFWGWASLGMLGLGYYIVPRISNTRLRSIKHGWYALLLINLAVLLGSCCLMAGINNGGGEYREYIWPVIALFAVGIVLTLWNFLRTIAHRTTKEIYISNWYIVSAIIFVLVITCVSYLPWWQNGLGETIIQGYWMHQAVGMWFMLFTLGIVYYFLPQQLNKPIYSYSLGILAFWSQILFYTVIGTHHFVFSAIPWWLQTVAIVGSMGMIIPVTAGTTNFLLTINGSWSSIGHSYTLPFFLTGIVFYFVGSMQGTAEAFRSTNLIWHFTDFTVAHSHLTMYGIISFFLWAAIYAVVPRLTGKEAPQIAIGTHFWLALIGLLFYTIPLMIGATLKGLLWGQGKPFIDGVVLMAPYWLWRAIGGSLMWFAHVVFCYNIYRMMEGTGIFIRGRPAGLMPISQAPTAPIATPASAPVALESPRV